MINNYKVLQAFLNKKGIEKVWLDDEMCLSLVFRVLKWINWSKGGHWTIWNSFSGSRHFGIGRRVEWIWTMITIPETGVNCAKRATLRNQALPRRRPQAPSRDLGQRKLHPLKDPDPVRKAELLRKLVKWSCVMQWCIIVGGIRLCVGRVRRHAAHAHTRQRRTNPGTTQKWIVKQKRGSRN